MLIEVQVFAGSDTTAIALRAILYFLMKDPDSKQTEVWKAYRACLARLPQLSAV